jgi:hypothetical protein
LQVTWQTEQRTAVLSVWHGDTCTATFQLPSEDTARLIAHLADGLADMAALAPSQPVATRPHSRWQTRFRDDLRRLREAMRRPLI